MTLTARAMALVVEPSSRAGQTVTGNHSSGSSPSRVVVLAAPEDAVGAACAVALALSGSGVAVAASWGEDGNVQPPAGALPAASRHAARLRAQGVDAEAAGRLVRVRIEGDEDSAVRVVEQVAAASDMPLAVALAAPRNGAMSEVLARADKVVVAAGRGRPNGLVEAAVAEARLLGHDAFVADLRPAGATKALLTLGFGLLPRIAGALREGLR